MTLEDAQAAYLHAVEQADPTKLVKTKVRTGALDDWFEDRLYPKPIHVIALGKAAPRMVWGLLESSVPFTGIGVTTRGQKRPTLERFWHEGGHPVPDASSFAAGQAVFDRVDRLPADAHVLVLLSGGASACVDVADDPDAVVASTSDWLRMPIEHANRERAQMSRFKGGGLGRRLLDAGADVRVWSLCDVPPEQHRVVGSGPCDVPDIEHTVLADASFVAEAAAGMLGALGHPTRVLPRVAGDLDAALDAALDGPTVAAGEVALAPPRDAPPGGRCSHAALAAAESLDSGVFFAGATDGIDGTTRDAAAWSSPGDADPEALAAWRSHEVLAAKGQTLRTGATGTNLNDLWIHLP